MKDFELNNILQNEYNRQKNGIELIASENSNNVLKLLGSVLQIIF